MSQTEDKIKQAADSLNERHRQKLLTLSSSSRHVILSYPFDMTDDELLDFLGYLTHQFRMELPPSIERAKFTSTRAARDG